MDIEEICYGLLHFLKQLYDKEAFIYKGWKRMVIYSGVGPTVPSMLHRLKNIALIYLN